MKLLGLCLWLVAVEAGPCNDNQQCASCDIKGQCLSNCNRGYYGYHCKHKCSSGCKNKVCHLTTSGNSECTFGCNFGLYGNRCNIPCDLHNDTCRNCPQKCEGGFCQLGSSCARGCQDSYYGTACKSCPAGCEVCNRVSGTCEVCLHCKGDCSTGCKEECRPGYFGKFCEHSCSLRCKAGCDKTSGDCFNCTSGWFGRECEKQCPITCLDKECDTDGLCDSGCTQGWFGPRCESQCSVGCLDAYCNQVGICSQGCTHGLYGKKCESRCGTGCANGICDRKGTCTDGCRDGFYGEQCKDKCSANCLNGECDDKDGICKPCKKNYHWSRCDKSCERCVDGLCQQDTGRCVKGCKSHYEGDFCQHDCKEDCNSDDCRRVCKIGHDTDTPSDDDTSNYIPYIVAAAVVLIVSALVTYAACRFKRLQSVIYGSMKGGQGPQLQPQRDPTEFQASEPTVNFYCELDEDATRPPQLPRRCRTEGSVTQTSLPENPGKGMSSSQGPSSSHNTEGKDDASKEGTMEGPRSVFPSPAEQKDDAFIHSEEGASVGLASVSPIQTEQTDAATVRSDEIEADGATTDLALHDPARPHSYLTALAHIIEVEEVDVLTEQAIATGSDTRPPELEDIRSSSKPQGRSLDLQTIDAQTSGFDAGSAQISTEPLTGCDAAPGIHVKNHGNEKSHLRREDCFADGNGYERALGIGTNTSHSTTESAGNDETDKEPPTISVPVIADCYDNFSADNDEEVLPFPSPDKYSKLFTVDYDRN